ncbi:MAG: hypothetical protein MJK14_14610 [Rivularia sp. ALOHA_DT_140]|nr:hypothetical protein [Rivularia sp. ALOHA_DT_140]
MSENKDKKQVKIGFLSNKSQESENIQPENEIEVTSENSNSGNTDKNQKPFKTIITTEILPDLETVGGIPPWDNDDDDDSHKDDTPPPLTTPPAITAEIPILDDEKEFNPTPRATGEIPPWDDEEEIK